MSGNILGIDPKVFEILDHDNLKGEVIGVAVTLMLLATIAVALRFYTRHWIMNKLWLDDYLAAAGLAGAITIGGTLCGLTKYGLGVHLWDFTSYDGLETFFKLFYFNSIFTYTSLLCTKLSLFFSYYRLIQQVPRYVIIYLSVMAVVASWTIASILILVFQCQPIRTYWTKVEGGHCINSDLLVWITSIGNIVTDVIVLLLPVPVVMRLNLKTGQKWAVIPIFALGFLTCIVSICRLVFFTVMSEDDLFYDFVPVFIWGQAEVTSGLICSALITLRPLMRLWSPNDGKPKGMTKKKTGRLYNLKASLEQSKKDSGKGYDGSEIELTRHGAMNSNQSQKKSLRSQDAHLDTVRSYQSRPSLQTNQDDPLSSAHRHDRFLGLESGVRTIISSGDVESIHSSSPDNDTISPSGIRVKQVWTVREKASEDEDLNGAEPTEPRGSTTG